MPIIALFIILFVLNKCEEDKIEDIKITSYRDGYNHGFSDGKSAEKDNICSDIEIDAPGIYAYMQKNDYCQ